MGAPQTLAKDRVYKYLKDHVGEFVSTSDMASDLGLSKDEASSNANRWAHTHQSGVRRMQGVNGMYGYFPSPFSVQGATEKHAPVNKISEVTPTDHILEILGQTSKFGILARDEQGNLYRVEKLD